MEHENIAAELYARAEALQTEARDLRDSIARIYTAAGQLKALAIRAAETLNSTQSKESKD